MNIKDRLILIGFPEKKASIDISHKEMEDYIKKVEHHLFVDVEGRLGEEGRSQVHAKHLRDKGFSDLRG